AQGLAAFALVQVGEHSADEFGFEHLLLLLDARAGGGEEEIDAAAVHRVALAEDVPGALEAVNGERHGGRGHAHVAGEIEEWGGLDVVQMIEDAGSQKAYPTEAIMRPVIPGRRAWRISWKPA